MNLIINSRALNETTCLLDMEGDVDFCTALPLKQDLMQAAERGIHRVIVNLSKVEYMDCAGGSRKRQSRERQSGRRRERQRGACMNIVWFLLLSAMLTAYAVLDGFDLGVGALLPWVCKNEDERAQARASIGPVWNGNEVWLLAAGGAIFAAFPLLYAASFSGFHLALMLVLWLLMGRGIGFEFRHAHPHPLWKGFWDTVFSGSSLLLALLFGVAVANVLRGVPFDAQGEFQGSFALMLNPFALLGGLLSVAVLCLHGAAFLAMKTEGALQQRARQLSGWVWLAALLLTFAFATASFAVRPGFAGNFSHMPVLLLLPLLALGALFVIPVLLRRAQDGQAFAATSVLIASLLGSAAAGFCRCRPVPAPAARARQPSRRRPDHLQCGIGQP